MVENKTHTLAVLLVVSAILVVGLLIGISWQVPYVIKENYIEKEPYESQEPYTEEEFYQEQVNLKYENVESYTQNCGSLFNYILCLYVKIENIDTEGGTFRIGCEFETLDGTLTDSDSTYIAPGEIKTLKCSADVDLGEDTNSYHHVYPGTKTLTKTRTITKYRTVTKYRDVTKTRDVTKYCSALNKLLGNC